MLRVFTVTLKICGPDSSRESDLRNYLQDIIAEKDISPERDIFSIEEVLSVEEEGTKRVISE